MSQGRITWQGPSGSLFSWWSAGVPPCGDCPVALDASAAQGAGPASMMPQPGQGRAMSSGTRAAAGQGRAGSSALSLLLLLLLVCQLVTSLGTLGYTFVQWGTPLRLHQRFPGQGGVWHIPTPPPGTSVYDICSVAVTHSRLHDSSCRYFVDQGYPTPLPPPPPPRPGEDGYEEYAAQVREQVVLEPLHDCS